MTVTIESPARALELLEAEVALVGEDYTYEYPEPPSIRCKYVHQGTPSCIVGRILSKLGATELELHNLNSEGTILGIVAQGLLPGITREAASVLRTAQHDQDNGKTWGEALEAARREAARYEMSAV